MVRIETRRFMLWIWSLEPYEEFDLFIPPLSEIATLSTTYFALSKIYTDEGGIK